MYRVAAFGSAFTLVPLIFVLESRYLARHTRVEGLSLEFAGTVAESYAKHLWWLFLSVITLFAYLPFVAGARNKWRVARTEITGGLLRSGSGLKRDLIDLAVMNVFALLVKVLSLWILRTPSEMLKIRFTMNRATYSGERVLFSGGNVKQLYRNGVIASLLRVFTVGISTIFEDYELEKWRAENTRLTVPEAEENDPLWRALEFFLARKYLTVAIIISTLALAVLVAAAVLIFTL